MGRSPYGPKQPLVNDVNNDLRDQGVPTVSDEVLHWRFSQSFARLIRMLKEAFDRQEPRATVVSGSTAAESSRWDTAANPVIAGRGQRSPASATEEADGGAESADDRES